MTYMDAPAGAVKVYLLQRSKNLCAQWDSR
jgi:hypothetical protein